MGDAVRESAGSGSDTVNASVSYALGAGEEIEFLRAYYTGTTGLSLTGNEKANTVIGGGGADTLEGGLGADVLTGGAGADTFVFATALGSGNVDRIGDFANAARAVHDTGELFYDADGSGATAAVKFALLSTRPLLSHADFQIVG